MNVPELHPLDVALRLERGEPLQVLDVRPANSVESLRIDDDLVGDDDFHNVLGSKLFTLPDAADAGLDRDRPVAVVCARGMASREATSFLRRQGFEAYSLAGGMAAWSLLLVPRSLEAPAGCRLLTQFDRVSKGSLGYLVVSDDQALVLDAGRNLAPIVKAAEAAGARITAVADTHLHADFLSGSAALAAHLGVPYFLHPADAVSPYDGQKGRVSVTPVEDGSRLPLGSVEVEVIHTPGHTEGSVCYRIGDTVLSGDFLFVASVGRPDLAGREAEWSQTLWQSLERARREWESIDPQILPGHYGRANERNPDRSVGRRFSTLAADNEPLRLDTQEAFLAWLDERRTTFPDSYRTIKEANLGLVRIDAGTAETLEAGKNECAAG